MDSAEDNRTVQKPRRTMSVPEMRRMLGLKKTESYWLVHREFFKTEMIGGRMRIDIESFEKWYANQVKHKKVNGELPGRELKERTYSFPEAANMLGIHDSDLYKVWKNEELEYIVVDFARRIPAEVFEKWYESQNTYCKVEHIPTPEELEENYICLQDAADVLGISREKLAKVARMDEIGKVLESTICNNKRWITRKSFQLFLNTQDTYQIARNEDETDEEQMLSQIKESVEIKEYISRQDAAMLAGVKESTITKWTQLGKFTCAGAGRVLRIHRKEFMQWLNEYREGVK